MTLKDGKINNNYRILSIDDDMLLRKRFIDLGFIKGKIIKIIEYAPLGDPIEVELMGYKLTIRKEEAEKIKVEDE